MQVTGAPMKRRVSQRGEMIHPEDAGGYGDAAVVAVALNSFDGLAPRTTISDQHTPAGTRVQPRIPSARAILHINVVGYGDKTR